MKIFSKSEKPEDSKISREESVFCKSYDRVLIVCEGEQTEPLYFESFKQEYDLSSANVVVTDASKGSDPVSVVRYAEKLFKASQKDNNAFDRVFCVFDKDQHGNYDAAVQMLSKGNSKFTAITSVPCFEYWFVLHFDYTTKSFPSATAVIAELKKHFPTYAKNSSIFYDLREKMPTAIKNAEKANAYASKIGTDNPSTKVVELVKYLLELNKKQ